MGVIRFAFSAGDYKNYAGQLHTTHCATIGELREEIKNIPDETRIVIYHQGEVARVEGFRADFPEKLRICAGEYTRLAGIQAAAQQSMTVGQLRRHIALLPKDCIITATDGKLSAPVYGFQKVCGSTA